MNRMWNPSDSSIRDLSNDALIIRLIQTVNHLSRWLTPIHDQTVLEFSPRRSEPSVKELCSVCGIPRLEPTDS